MACCESVIIFSTLYITFSGRKFQLFTENSKKSLLDICSYVKKVSHLQGSPKIHFWVIFSVMEMGLCGFGRKMFHFLSVHFQMDSVNIQHNFTSFY